MDEQRIREIVREEIAAHKEQPEIIAPFLKIDGKALAADLSPYFQAYSTKDGMPPEARK